MRKFINDKTSQVKPARRTASAAKRAMPNEAAGKPARIAAAGKSTGKVPAAQRTTPARKAICLLTAAALVATMGFGAAFAVNNGNSDDDALVVNDIPMQAEGENAAQDAAANEQAETASSTSAEGSVSESAAAKRSQTRGVSQLSSAQVSSVVWIKSGAVIYKSTSDSNGRSVLLSYRVKITGIETVDGATWYKFDFVGLGDKFLSGYHYVKAQDTSTTKPSDSSEGGISASDGSVSLTLSGTPSGATATAKTLSPKEYSSEAFEKIGSHKVAFAVDVSIKNSSNQEWQPSGGESVAVSLDASKLGLEDGGNIAILHEHDGQLQELGTYAVAGGKLTFETDGFSSFYGYTVDFEYDGTWYSIGGGSDVYLYELFARLGIDRSADDVIGVTVSNENLLSAGQVIADGYTGETTWMIHSIKAFDTEETVDITFNDGATIMLNVYDANYTSLSAVTYTFNNGDTIGEMSIPNDSTVSITLDGTVTMNGKISVGQDVTLTITGSGILKRGSSNIGDLFYVASGGKLIIKGAEGDGITIDGGASWSSTDVADSTRKLLKVTSGEGVTGSAIYVGYPGTTGIAATVGNVTLENVTLQNLYSAEQAPAIHVTGGQSDAIHSTATLKSVKVNNCATVSDHSIMLFNDCVADLTSCTIDNNYSGNRYAGAVKAGGSDWFSQLSMKSCNATGNYSSGWGGVVLWAANSSCDGKPSKATIDGCNLTGNIARYLGGALSNEAIMEVKNCTIGNNHAMAGGGIATFPFTLTKDTTEDANACGLTLGVGNTISGNTAYATGAFTPFSTQDAAGTNPSGDDCEKIDNLIDYTGGGGGVWCYMNKNEWTCSLEIGSGNTISSNAAENVGGGVYVDKVAGLTTTLSITGAEISDNKAVNGGGVAVKDAAVNLSSGKIENNTASKHGGGIYVESGSATVTGTGSVESNTARNGGGLYIHSGSMTVSGGIIALNKATGNYSGNTTKVDADSLSGVGGGVFLEKGTFTLSGSYIGIYSNTASVAANDVYASGCDTTLTVPEVKDMNLSGMTGEVKPTGWYEDYKSDDSNYPFEKTNPGRYVANAEGNVEVPHDTLDANQTTFYCLTLGIPHPGYGQLIITKNLTERASEDQTFVFEVSGDTSKGSDYSLTVTVIIEKGKTNSSVTVNNIPDGTYTVTEETGWSWRYEQVGSVVYSPEKTSSGGEASDDSGALRSTSGNGDDVSYEKITVGALNPNWTATVTNGLTEDKWLSGDCYCKNWWDKLKETVSDSPSTAVR